MNIYIWTDMKTGAYHGDGVACVMANDLEQAYELLGAKAEWTYNFEKPARAEAPDTYYNVDGVEGADHEPQVLIAYEGCDC